MTKAPDRPPWLCREASNQAPLAAICDYDTGLTGNPGATDASQVGIYAECHYLTPSQVNAIVGKNLSLGSPPNQTGQQPQPIDSTDPSSPSIAASCSFVGQQLAGPHKFPYDTSVELDVSNTTPDAKAAFSNVRQAEASAGGPPPVDAQGIGDAAFFLPVEDTDGVPTVYVLASNRIFTVRFQTPQNYPTSPTGSTGSGPEWTALRKLAADVIAAFGDQNPSKPGSGEANPSKPVCRASGDYSLEHEIHKVAERRFPIPIDTIRLPAQMVGKIAVNFVPGDAQTCRDALTTAIEGPGAFAGGELAIGADSSDGAHHWGPFKYETSTVSWEPAPDMPPGQDLTTHFSPPSAEGSLSVHPSLSYSRKGGLEPAITVAEADLKALPLDITLIQRGKALLQVTLGPTINIEAQLSLAQLQQDAEEAKAAGEDTATAAEDVAQASADDVAAGVEETAYEFYGVDVHPAARALYSDLEPQLASFLEADPALIDFGVASADAVSADAIGAADGAAIDAELGAEAFTFEGSDLLLLIFL